MRAGYLSVPSQSLNSANVFMKPRNGSSGTLTSIASISKAASGSLAAIGGHGAVHDAGGGGFGGLRTSKPYVSAEREQAALSTARDLQLALPSTGSFLKLLTEARAHLMTLLSKTKYKEAPLYLLHERWDGGIESSDSARRTGRLGRGFAEVLPGRTRKWKQFYGLRFDWVLEECVGAGLVEVFETGSVGRGVRVV